MNRARNGTASTRRAKIHGATERDTTRRFTASDDLTKRACVVHQVCSYPSALARTVERSNSAQSVLRRRLCFVRPPFWPDPRSCQRSANGRDEPAVRPPPREQLPPPLPQPPPPLPLPRPLTSVRMRRSVAARSSSWDGELCGSASWHSLWRRDGSRSEHAHARAAMREPQPESQQGDGQIGLRAGCLPSMLTLLSAPSLHACLCSVSLHGSGSFCVSLHVVRGAARISLPIAT